MRPQNGLRPFLIYYNSFFFDHGPEKNSGNKKRTIMLADANIAGLFDILARLI